MAYSQFQPSELMRAVYLKIVPGTIRASSASLFFQCTNGDKSITGRIAADAVNELVQFHNIRLEDGNSFAALVKAIELLLNRKFSVGRVERNGELVIRKTDVLRYGLRDIDSAA
jgi:hypothetical protein